MVVLIWLGDPMLKWTDSRRFIKKNMNAHPEGILTHFRKRTSLKDPTLRLVAGAGSAWIWKTTYSWGLLVERVQITLTRGTHDSPNSSSFYVWQWSSSIALAADPILSSTIKCYWFRNFQLKIWQKTLDFWFQIGFHWTQESRWGPRTTTGNEAVRDICLCFGRYNSQGLLLNLMMSY